MIDFRIFDLKKRFYIKIQLIENPQSDRDFLNFNNAEIISVDNDQLLFIDKFGNKQMFRMNFVSQIKEITGETE